jgi:NADH-quinone oxidoreductase subunit F
MLKVLNRLVEGDGAAKDFDLLHSIANNIDGNTVCALGEAAAWPVKFTIERFRKELEAELER